MAKLTPREREEMAREVQAQRKWIEAANYYSEAYAAIEAWQPGYTQGVIDADKKYLEMLELAAATGKRIW